MINPKNNLSLIKQDYFSIHNLLYCLYITFVIIHTIFKNYLWLPYICFYDLWCRGFANPEYKLHGLQNVQMTSHVESFCTVLTGMPQF